MRVAIKVRVANNTYSTISFYLKEKIYIQYKQAWQTISDLCAN